MWERKFRAKSPARILEEMHRLFQERGLKSFALTHDNFTTSHRYIDSFAEHFEKNNTEGFVWSASARPDTLTPGRIEALYRAGCRGLFFGIDTGSPKIQKIILKNLDLDHCKEMLKRATSLDIKVLTSFVLGFPTESDDDLNRTVDLALESKLIGADKVAVHRLSPLAGSAIEREHHREIRWTKSYSNISYLPYESSEIDNMIAAQPRLFSSFYEVLTPSLDNLDLTPFCSFYEGLLNRLPQILRDLMRATRWTPITLFRRWALWKESLYPQRTIDEAFLFNTFPAFIRSLS